MATLNVAVLSSEQREIWQAERAYWALVKNRDVEGLIGLAHDRVTAWPHVASAPMDSVGFREDARMRGERDAIAAYELSFHTIEVHGDTAIVYYTVAAISSTTPPDAAAPGKRRACITHTWIRDCGAWRLAGGMSRPAG
jgi:ketosteroid isomerase-like protein